MNFNESDYVYGVELRDDWFEVGIHSRYRDPIPARVASYVRNIGEYAVLTGRRIVEKAESGRLGEAWRYGLIIRRRHQFKSCREVKLTRRGLDLLAPEDAAMYLLGQ